MVSRKKEQGIKANDIVNMFEIFTPHEDCSQPRTVLIEGQPGMGKTTYCNKYKYKERLRLYKRWPCSTYILNRVN